MAFDKYRVRPKSMADISVNGTLLPDCNPTPYHKTNLDLNDGTVRKQAWLADSDTPGGHEKVVLSSSFSIPFERKGSRRYAARSVSFSDKSTASLEKGSSRMTRRRSGAIRKVCKAVIAGLFRFFFRIGWQTFAIS